MVNLSRCLPLWEKGLYLTTPPMQHECADVNYYGVETIMAQMCHVEEVRGGLTRVGGMPGAEGA